MTADVVLWSAFTAGIASSIGPCLAPRYLVLAAEIAAGSPARNLAAFACGCAGGYIVFASAAAVPMLLRADTHAIYAATAVVLVASGAAMLVTPHKCGAVAKRAGAGASLGARFLSGVWCSVFGSPCCAPIAFGLGLQSSQDASFGAMTLGAFGAGHVMPVLVCALGMRLNVAKAVFTASPVTATIGGTLLVAVGLLYGAVA